MTEEFIEEAIQYCKTKTCLCEDGDCNRCKNHKEIENVPQEPISQE